MQIKAIWPLLKETFNEWRADNAPRLAAALSYYAAIAMAPLIVGVLALAGLVFSTEQAQAQLVAQVNRFAGAQGSEMVETILANADQPGLARLAGLLSLVTLLWAASNIFAQLQDALDTIWGVELRPDLGLLRKIGHRLLPLLMVLGIGLLLLIAIAASAILAALGNLAADLLPGVPLLWQILNFLISLAVITLLFALVFKLLPDVHFAWRDVWLGAGLTALLFVVGQSVLGWYLGRQSGASLYGAAGSLVLLLLWIYYSAQIFFFGAEFTQVYATRYGEGVRPNKDAVARRSTAPLKPAARVALGGAPERPARLQLTARPLDALSFGELAKGLANDWRTLFRQEIALARAEVGPNLAKALRGAALTAGGGLALYAGAVGLLLAVALLLSTFMPLSLAIFLVGILVLVEGWILSLWAQRTLKQVRFIPKRTVESLREDVETLKDRVAS